MEQKFINEQVDEDEYEVELVEDIDLEEVVGGIKIGSIFITCK